MASQREVAARREQLINFVKKERIPCTIRFIAHRLHHFEMAALRADVLVLCREGKLKKTKIRDLTFVGGRGKKHDILVITPGD
jgi:hypothetical protein